MCVCVCVCVCVCAAAYVRCWILHPGWKEESRAGVAAPPVVGEGLFWKFHLFGICNDGYTQRLAEVSSKGRGHSAKADSLLQSHVSADSRK